MTSSPTLVLPDTTVYAVTVSKDGDTFTVRRPDGSPVYCLTAEKAEAWADHYRYTSKISGGEAEFGISVTTYANLRRALLILDAQEVECPVCGDEGPGRSIERHMRISHSGRDY